MVYLKCGLFLRRYLLSLNKHLNERMDAQLEIECVCAVEFSSLSIRWQHSDKIKG